MQECKSHGPLTRRRWLRTYSAYRAAADAIAAPAMTGVRGMPWRVGDISWLLLNELSLRPPAALAPDLASLQNDNTQGNPAAHTRYAREMKLPNGEFSASSPAGRLCRQRYGQAEHDRTGGAA